MEETPIHSPYKTLVVDDSAIVRGLVTRMMADDAEIEVVGSVANGEEALDVMAKGGIEVVVLDIEMPVMDGLTALPKILEIDPTVRVIMASTLTKRNADISFQAMTLGAVDYIPKPSSSKDLNVGEGFREELLDKVKAWAEQRRKMLEVEAHDAADHADDAEHLDHDDQADHTDHTEQADQAAVQSDALKPEPDTDETSGAADSHVAGAGKHDYDHGAKGNAPFRAEMSVEHQQMHKPGRIQRKRFTAELRPRPTQYPGRQTPVQMRHQPAHPTPASTGQPAPAAHPPHTGQPNHRVTPSGDAVKAPPRPAVQQRDPGRLIREAALAVGDHAAKTAPVKPTLRGAGATEPAARKAPPRPTAPAPKKSQRLREGRNAGVVTPAPRGATRGKFSMLPEKRLVVEAIAIGSSTGGPQALFEVLRGLKGVRQPIFITQHMPATFTTILAEHISRLTGLTCQEGQTGMQVVGGQVYLAPGDYHMTVEGRGNGRHIVLNQNPPENFCRPSVDPMLRSLVASYGSNILTAILTGMGQDGMLGGREVVGAGGMVIAQDEQTSVVWGMPGAAAHAGICSAVLPVGGIAAYIKKFAGGR